MANAPFGKLGFHEMHQLFPDALPPACIHNKQLGDFGVKYGIAHGFSYLAAAEPDKLILIGGDAYNFICVGLKRFPYRGKRIAVFAVEQVVELLQFLCVGALRYAYVDHNIPAFCFG